MADLKISQMPLLAQGDLVSTTDYLPVVDPSEATPANRNKRILASSLVLGSLSTSTSTLFGLGSVGAPSIAFTGDPNTGVWSPGGDTWAVSTNGTEALRINSVQQVVTTAGTALLPAVTPTGDPNTGVWSPGADTWAVSTGGVEGLRLDATQNLLLGTTTNTNSSKLVVNGTLSETVSGTQYLVASSFDVGTAPNQIPLNQYLGSLAFEDADAVAVGLLTSSSKAVLQTLTVGLGGQTTVEDLVQ